jgi:hypothetical protein
MKVGLKHYYAPTPVKIRKIADGLTAISVAAGSLAFAQDNKTVSVIILVTSILGKLLSNLFAHK